MCKRSVDNPNADPRLNAILMFAASMGAGGPSQAIEEQEAAGQSSFVNSTTLPRRMQDVNGRAIRESWGIVFDEGEVDDKLFFQVTLPTGWVKRQTGHSMWSELVDDQGKVRATMFYKAAFYDRDAFLVIKREFLVEAKA